MHPDRSDSSAVFHSPQRFLCRLFLTLLRAPSLVGRLLEFTSSTSAVYTPHPIRPPAPALSGRHSSCSCHQGGCAKRRAGGLQNNFQSSEVRHIPITSLFFEGELFQSSKLQIHSLQLILPFRKALTCTSSTNARHHPDTILIIDTSTCRLAVCHRNIFRFQHWHASLQRVDLLRQTIN